MFESLVNYYKGVAYKWDITTIWFYMTVIGVVYLLAALSQSKIVLARKGERYVPGARSRLGVTMLVLSFIVMWVILAFRDVGTDLEMYRRIFERPFDFLYVETQFEPGYMLLNKALNMILPDAYWGIAVISAMSLFFQYKAIEDNFDRINVGLAVLALGCMYYLQSFNLIRICLASNILMWGSRFIFRGEYKKYLILNFLTIFIHFSSTIVFYPFLLYYLWGKRKWMFWIVTLISVIVAYKSLAILSMIPVFGRYMYYLENGAMKNSIGLMQYAINLPLFLLYFYSYKRIGKTRYVEMLFAYTVAALVIGIMSYKVLMLGRSLVYFNVVYVLCVPYVIFQLRRQSRRVGRLLYIGYAVYLFARLYIYLTEYLYLDGIMPYRMIEMTL